MKTAAAATPADPLTRDLVALHRGLMLFPSPAVATADPDGARLAASLQAELMNLGFALDPAAFAAAAAATPRDWLVAYHHEAIGHLRMRLGAGRPYRPFYLNFPAQVMEMSHLELFINAIGHYWSGGTWEPPQVLRDRGFAFEDVRFKTLRPGTDADLLAGFTAMVSANGSLTEQDKQVVAWMIDQYAGRLTLPAEVPFKETLCLLAAKGLDVPIKTPTDVLRIAVYMSGGDVSLPGVPKPVKGGLPPEAKRNRHLRQYVDQLRAARIAARDKFKFKKFTRADRRRLLAFLEKTSCDVTEMQRHLGRWLRLGEVLHPGELAAKFPRAAEAFRVLRNQRKGTRVRTWAARVDLAFAANWHEGLELLATRPGELARRLDWLLRTYDRGPVLAAFERVADRVSSKVLFELYDHFGARAKAGAPRVVMIKGARAKMKTLDPLPPMDADLVQNVGNTILAVMRRRIAALPPLGKVWVDPRLKEVPVPFAMRSVNTAVRTYVRGTRVPFRPGAKVLRPFVHWFDKDGDQDIDLSVGLYDEDFKPVGHVSWTGLKDLGCCHSGDVRCRRGACAEYVDIPVAAATAAGVRYATVQVFNYQAHPMHTVKDCVFGLMEREHARANEVFVPKTIADCTALANEGTAVVACVLDLVESRYIWADVESDRSLATLENTAGRTAEVLAALIHNTKMPVYELLMLHARARGTPVDDPAAADVVLRWEDLVTDYARVTGYMTF